jgi:hypothetical protein
LPPEGGAGGRDARAPEGGWPVYEIRHEKTHEIRWSVDKDGRPNLRASCGWCGRTRSRRMVGFPGGGASMKRLGQGRPLGSIWSFAVFGDASRGEACGLNGGRHANWTPSYAQRVQGRRDAEAVLPLDSVFRQERAPNIGVADGPEGEL